MNIIERRTTLQCTQRPLVYLTTGVNNLKLFKLQGGFKDYNERSRRDVRRVEVASLMTSLMTSPDDGERAHCVRRLPSAAT